MKKVNERADQEEVLETALRLLRATQARNALSSSEAEEGKDAVFRRMERKLGRPAHPICARLLRYGSIAAAIAVLIAVSFLIRTDRLEQENALAQVPVVMEVPEGSISRVILPDGSRVTLNSSSSLTYPAVFAATREVSLHGEGYFEVEKDERSPFIVHTGHLSAKVLGTCFSLKAYDTDRETLLTLAEGAVQVLTNPDQEAIFLSPYQQVVVDNQTGVCFAHEVDVADYICWKDGFLVFKDQTLEEISAILERRFNVEIAIDSDSIRQDKYVASFRRHEKLDEILEKLSYQRDWTFVHSGGGKIQLVKRASWG